MTVRSILAALLSITGLVQAAAPVAAAPALTTAERQAAADKAVAYMGEIAKAAIHDDELQGLDWTEFSLVMGFDESGSLNETYGYAYDASGDSTAISIRPRVIRQPVEAYRAWLEKQRDGGAEKSGSAHSGIIRMLFQFNRATNKVNADFEYDDPDRWKVTPDNLDAMIETLRPKL